MSRSATEIGLRRLAVAVALGILLRPFGSAGQITPDATLGTTVDAAGCANCLIEGGKAVGGNLFHSFTAFTVAPGGSATFAGDPATVNVLSRVTGNSLSRIDGFVDTRSFMPTANFFLINPNGVIVGASSFLNVGGAIHISTADYIKLADGVLFSASPISGEASLLSSAAPQAFGFLGNTTGEVKLETNAFLGVDPGQTLSLIGGSVTIDGGFAFAQSGLLQIAAVRAGEAHLDAPGLGLGASSLLGNVTISNGSFISAGTDFFNPGGTVVIRAGQLIIESGSIVSSDTADASSIAGVPGLDFFATESILIRNSALVKTESFGSADAPGIVISTRGTLTISTGASVESLASFDGNSGPIDIQVGRLDVLGATLRTTTNASSAGNITIEATDTVTVAGTTGIISSGTPSSDPDDGGGNISISAQNVLLSDGGMVASGGTQETPGEFLRINAEETLSISGAAGVSSLAFSQDAGVVELSGTRFLMDGGFVTASTFGAGAAGQVRVQADVVSLTNGAQIASSTQLGAPGAGGSISVIAPASVTITGIGTTDAVSNKTFTGVRNSGIFSTTKGSGSAGQVSITTPNLALSNGGLISVATTAGGRGGEMTISGSVFVSGTGSGLFSTASSTGNAGAIAVAGPVLTISDGGTIDSSTTGAGAGGAINVTASNEVNITGGGNIRADSLGSGFTGQITVTAGDRIVMDGGSISTRAATSDGGNITLVAPNIIRLTDSQITTSVEGEDGAGGNVFIDPEFVILQGSTITANAFGGPGGNITIVANNFLADPASSVTASSALSTPGTVQIQSPDNNLASDIAQLPSAPIDASRLMAGACSARRAGAPSSFQVAGRGGVPADPDGYLPAFGASGGAKLVGAPYAPRAAQTPGFTLAMAGWDCWR